METSDPPHARNNETPLRFYDVAAPDLTRACEPALEKGGIHAGYRETRGKETQRRMGRANPRENSLMESTGKRTGKRSRWEGFRVMGN